MIVTSKITMDLHRRGVAPCVSTVQDDKYSRNLEITLTAGGEALALPADTTALVRYCKADGTGGNYDALPDDTVAYTIEGNVVTVALAPQVCTAPGMVRLVVALISGSSQLHTFLIKVDVQPNPGLQVVSEGYYKVTGAVADAGWEPNMYLGTDENGNVVAKEAPSGTGSGTGGGATDEQIAEAVAAYMAENPVQDGEDGYTPVKGVDYYTEEEQAEMVEAVLGEFPVITAVAVTETDTTVTMAYTIDDGSTMSDTITFDANGYATNINANGTDIPVTWGVS